MNSNLLLSSSSLFNVQLIDFVYAQSNHESGKKKIADVLNVTEYKLSSLLKYLAVDVQKVIGDPSVKIQVNVHTVKLVNFTEKVIQMVQLYYLKHSDKFKVFNYICFKEKVDSRKKFLQESFMSQPNYYTVRQNVNKLLKKNHFPSESLSIVANHEYITRKELTSFYYKYFDGLESPFPELSKVTKQFIELIQRKFNIFLSPRQMGKLQIFIEVQLARIRNKCYLFSMDGSNDCNADESLIKSLHFFYESNIINDKKVDVNSEITYLILFLTAQNIIPETKLPLMSKYQGEMDGMFNFLSKNRDLIHIPVGDLNESEIEKFRDEIKLVTKSTLIFDIDSIGSSDEKRHENLKGIFPISDTIATDICSLIIKYFGLDPTPDERKHMKLNYIMAVILGLPKNMYSFPLNITVDFSNNAEFNAYVVGFIDPLYDVKLQRTITSNTDLYITDHYTKRINKIPQIVWTSPVTPDKINDLSEMMIKLQNKKLKEHEKS